MTHRTYALTQDQEKAFLAFFASQEPPEPPFPVLGDIRNRRRVSPVDAHRSGVYRDIWERRRPSRESGVRCRVRNELDYPAEFEEARRGLRALYPDDLDQPTPTPDGPANSDAEP